MQGCNRSQPHVDLLRHANAILAHVARYQQLHQALLASPDCVQVIAEQLQMFRDKQVCLNPADVPPPCLVAWPVALIKAIMTFLKAVACATWGFGTEALPVFWIQEPHPM